MIRNEIRQTSSAWKYAIVSLIIVINIEKEFQSGSSLSIPVGEETYAEHLEAFSWIFQDKFGSK